MELLQLRYFKLLAHNQHLTNTAKELMIAPPSLSSAISKLEAELGVKLFDRSPRKITLNANGKMFLNYIEQALQNIDTAISAMNDIAGKHKAVLKVGLTSLPIWYDMLNSYTSNRTNIDINYSVIPYDQLTKNPDIDFFIGAIQDLNSDLYDYHLLMPDEKPYVVMSVKHPLAERDHILMSELKEETFSSLGDSNPASPKYLHTLCSAAGFQPKHILHCDYFFREKALKENRCIAITTDLGYKLNYLNTEAVVKIPISDSPIYRTQCIAWKKGGYLSRPHHEFIEYVVDFYKDFSFES